ncbi:MAG: hypothetical protein R2745_14390 [Vicinamibacterales bacterium]
MSPAGRPGISGAALVLLAAIVVCGAPPVAAQPARDPAVAIVGGLKGDESTYIAIAASLADDGDLRFDARDYARFRQWYGTGPEGIFLKRDATGQLRFGKAFVHGLLAAPFVRAFGLSGLLVLNVVLLLTAAAAGAWWASSGSRAGPAVAFAGLFVGASVVPLYGAWLTSDLANFVLVFLAFVAGVSRGVSPVPRWRLAIALVLLALATFSKPIVLPLAAPLVLANAGWRTRRALGLAAGYAVLVALLFGANAWIAGEANYQGGARKTFYGRFPFDEQGGTFETTGIDLATDTILTPVGDEGRAASVLANLEYFVAGRHFGLVPFGWTWLLVFIAWLAVERRKQPWQWLLAAALGGVALVTVVWMPYTWSGGGGPIGNRYFLSVAGAVFVLMPPIRSWRPVALAAVGLAFLWPAYRHPFLAAKEPWLATRAPQFEWLPLELTGASDFPVILDQGRGRVPQGHDPQVFLALLDEDAGPARDGWVAVAPGETTELLVRAPVRLSSAVIGVRGRRPCTVTVASDAGRQVIAFEDTDRQDVDLPLPQVFSRDSYVSVVRVDASACHGGAAVAVQGRVAR